MFGKQLLKERLLFPILQFQLILALRIDNKEEPKINKSEYINISLHLTRKYAGIFACGHHLFRQAKTVSFDQRTYNVQGQVSKHIFAPNGGDCVYYCSNLSCNMHSFENWGIFSDIPQFQLGNIRSCDALRPITRAKRFDGL